MKKNHHHSRNLPVLHTTKTTNAFCANEQREKFFSDKVLTMLITFLKEIGVESGNYERRFSKQ